MKKVHRFFDLSISDKKMAMVMYAILRTKANLVNSYSPSLYQNTRKQSSGFLVQVVILIQEDKISLFEELSEVKTQTSIEFQGKISVNS